MRVYRHLLSLAAVAVSVLVAPAAAKAEPYPPPPPTLTVSAGQVTAGNSVVVTGSGFGAHENVSIDVTYRGGAIGRYRLTNALAAAVPDVVTAPRRAPRVVVAWTVADANGSFRTSVALSQIGTALITMTGQSTGRIQSVTVTVLGSSGGGLPATGTDGRLLRLTIVGGASAVLLGVFLLWLVVRRRSQSGPPSDAGA